MAACARPAGPPEGAEHLAARVQHLIVGYEPCQYAAAQVKSRRRPYGDADSEGFIELSYAENKVMGDRLAERLGSLETERRDFEYPEEWYGSDGFRAALSTFLNARLGYNSTPESLVTMGGTSSVIEAAIAALCDEGDVAFCLAPYYSAFSKILSYRCRVELVPVYPEQPAEGYGSYAGPLEAALARVREGGSRRRPRLLLLSNPSNPAGRLATEAELAPVVALAAREGLHTLVDEIYALSVHDPDARFVSACRVAERLGPTAAGRTHVAYGFSKDFASSGLRVGLLHSRHTALLLALQQTSRFAACSTLSVLAVRQLIEAPAAWLDSYLEALRSRLHAACAALCSALAAARISFVQPQAGLFVLVHMGEFLPLAEAYFAKTKGPLPPDPDAEDLLFKYLLEEVHVNLSPGRPTGARPPGWFRICVAQDERNVREFAARLARLAELARAPGGVQALEERGAFFALRGSDP